MTGMPQQMDLRIPTRTIVKIALSLLVVWAVVRLWPEFVLLLIAVVLALALHPVVDWLERKGLGRGTAILLIAVALVTMIVGFLTLMTTSLAEQISRLVSNFPDFRARVEHRLPGKYPVLKRIVDEIFALPNSPELAAHLKRPLALGTSVLAGALSMFFAMIMTLYLLMDGKRLYAWLIAYVPRKHRDKMAVTADEVSVVVQAYVRGQVITSALFTVYVAIILTAFKVPAALPLALLAGICDVIPVVGIIIATAPGAVLAFTVSPMAGLMVTLLYGIYHAVESYYIVPRVYGSRLRLSTLAVLLALMVGSALQGLVGAILILPVVAAYPIIERIWLTRYLSPEVIKDHGALAGSVESDQDEQVVETVLQGEKHPWEGPTGTTAPLWNPQAVTSAAKSANANRTKRG
ncbi:MAG: AI-2E family transporter [Myxococcales bacterium]